MLARHSKQIPMPQSGPRGSPVTEVRVAVKPATRSAAAADVPAATRTSLPFTTISMLSAMRAHSGAGWQVGFRRNGRRTAGDLRRDQLRGGKRGGDTQSFVTSGERHAIHRIVRSDQRELVFSGGAESGPDADHGKPIASRHEQRGMPDH